MACHIVRMIDPVPYILTIRPCTLTTRRYRWDIRRGGRPVQSSLDSFDNEQKARTHGTREVERLTRIAALDRKPPTEAALMEEK